jgi:hypothetical protein
MNSYQNHCIGSTGQSTKIYASKSEKGQTPTSLQYHQHHQPRSHPLSHQTPNKTLRKNTQSTQHRPKAQLIRPSLKGVSRNLEKISLFCLGKMSEPPTHLERRKRHCEVKVLRRPMSVYTTVDARTTEPRQNQWRATQVVSRTVIQ